MLPYKTFMLFYGCDRVILEHTDVLYRAATLQMGGNH